MTPSSLEARLPKKFFRGTHRSVAPSDTLMRVRPFAAQMGVTRLGNVTAVKLALQSVDLVADAAGMNSVQTSSPIQRCWQDAHTASQHVLLNTARFEVVGRVLFGLDPGSPVI